MTQRARYYLPDSQLIGWALYTYENGVMVKYSADTHLWAETPNNNVLFLAKYFRDSEGKLVAQQINVQDLYALTEVQEQAAALVPGIKLGVYIEDEAYRKCMEDFMLDFTADSAIINKSI